MSARMETTKKYKNSEPVRQCPFCNEEHAGRGLYNHVNLKDDPNGPHLSAGKVPEGFTVDETEIVGYADVELNRRSNYQQDHNRFVCQYCGTTTKGKSGLGVHLENKVGDPLHSPPDLLDQMESGQIQYDQHQVFPATEDNRILVPADNHLGEVRLTETERDEGFIVEVDESLEPITNTVDIAEPPDAAEQVHKGDVLEEIRLRFKQYLNRGEDIDPVQAFEEVKEAHEQPAN